MHRSVMLVVVLLAALASAGCASEVETSSPSPSPEAASGQDFPDIVEAELSPEGGETWSLAVTVSSRYDTPERYADGWRVLAQDGEVLGTHELMHDHAGEQPFTRTQTGLRIPEDVDEITVEGRDLANGYGGDTATIAVPNR